MAISAAPAAAEARSNAYRLRLAPNRVYACRFCREAVRVTSTRYLPESCPACGTATWAEDGRCANRVDCAAARRPGQRRPLPLPRLRLQRLDADRASAGDRRSTTPAWARIDSPP